MNTLWTSLVIATLTSVSRWKHTSFKNDIWAVLLYLDLRETFRTPCISLSRSLALSSSLLYKLWKTLYILISLSPSFIFEVELFLPTHTLFRRHWCDTLIILTWIDSRLSWTSIQFASTYSFLSLSGSLSHTNTLYLSLSSLSHAHSLSIFLSLTGSLSLYTTTHYPFLAFFLSHTHILSLSLSLSHMSGNLLGNSHMMRF